MSFDEIAKSADLTSVIIERAAASSSSLKLLLQRVAEIAQPEQGWTRLYKVIAKVATADWLEGELQVDFTGVGHRTTVACYSVLGAGIRERLFAPIDLAVPIDEFQRALVLHPDSVAPLRARQGLQKMTLARSTNALDRELPDFELEEQALGDGERITAPPPPFAIADEELSPDVFTRSTKPPPLR